MDKIKRIGRKEVHQGRIIRVVQDEMQMPDGRTVNWDTVLHPGAAAVIPVTKEGNILLVKQFRNAVDTFSLELPAGCLEPNEDPMTCAMRELEEETGFSTDAVAFLVKSYSAIGFCNEAIYIYLATNLLPSKQYLDEDEYVEVEAYSLETCIQMIYDGKINDSKTIIGLLAYKDKY